MSDSCIRPPPCKCMPSSHSATPTNPVQEAHEAIRPTDPSTTAQQLAKMGLEVQAARLYGLIRSRALASQMTPAKLRLVRVVLVGWSDRRLHCSPL